MPHPMGQDAIMHILGQSAPDVAADGDYLRSAYHTLSPRESRPFENDSLVGAQYHNSRDAQAPGPGLPEDGADMEVPLCAVHLGYWLPHLFRHVSSAGDPGEYLHTFETGAGQHSGASIAWQDADKIKRLVGWVGSRFEINVGRESGYRRVRLGGMAVRTEHDVAEAALGDPPAPRPHARSVAAFCGIYKGGQEVARIMSGSVSIERDLTPLTYAREDTDRPSGFSPEETRLGGTLTLRVLDSMFYEYARAGFSPAGVDDWRFVWPCAGGAKLELDAAAVRFELAGRGIDTRFGRQETYTLHGEQTASAAMARLMLTNSVEDYDDAMEE